MPTLAETADALVLTCRSSRLDAAAVEEARDHAIPSSGRIVVLDVQTVHNLVSGSLLPEEEPFVPLLNLRAALAAAGRRLVLAHVSAEVAEVLATTRLDRVLETAPDVAAAVTSADPPGYSHTQWAPLCLILYGFAIWTIGVYWFAPPFPGALIGMGLLAGLFALLGSAFQFLRVEDRGDRLDVRFGPLPLFRTTVRYVDIESVDVGRTLIIESWGVHLSVRGGWVWNLWGRDCVVVRHRRTTLRIGTDDSRNLARFLESKIAARPPLG
ncbi:MAG: hypothetical protein KF774_13830 [Planctomyces sp.]|nr:hypothetical protein [Planctomyces sp.]